MSDLDHDLGAVKWIHGAPDCTRSSDPPIEVHRFERDTFMPEEHALPLEPRHVLELHQACDAMADAPRREVRDEFIIELVQQAAPA